MFQNASNTAALSTLLTFYLNDGVTIATDLSAPCATKWICVSGLSRGSLDIGWTGQGEPYGNISLRVSNHGNEANLGAIYSPVIATQPVGYGNTLFVGGLEIDSYYVKVVYIPTSGGTGTVFTDSTGVSGTQPIFVAKGSSL